MKIINISNRLPITFIRKENNIEIRTSSGGLVSAMLSLQSDNQKLLWIGVADFSKSDFEEGIRKHDGSIELHPVYLNKDINYGYYNGFSNAVLWPLFHYFPSFVEYKPANFETYIKANKIIADEVCKICADDDLIWIHDYQLIPLVAMIRELRPELKIGFFLHIPFPSYELIRILPKNCRDFLIKSMLGADLIGFHTYEYVQHFLTTVKMIAGIQHKQFSFQYDNRNIKVEAFPISIDFEKFNSAFHKTSVEAEREKLKSQYGNKKIIFSVDRLDYTKGITYRLRGYARFLNEFPEWKENIVFLLVAIPSRTTIGKYIERKQMIELLISEINGKYGNTKWTPVVYQYGSLSFSELLGLYTGCDIALISPLRDGMNLVAKEFVASRNDLDGVLLLSDMTGAAKELTDSLLFNPLDENEISEKIHAALRMNEDERKKRMTALQTHVRNNNVFKWGQDFIDVLKSNTVNKQSPKNLTEHHSSHIIQKFNSATKRLLLLDYDGTLREFSADPEKAFPGERVLNILNSLSSDTKNDLAIVSGRNRDTLEGWLGHLPLTLIAEHGCYSKKGEWELNLQETISWKTGVGKIMRTFAENCSGAFIEEKSFSICWHYRNADFASGFSQSRELISVLNDFLKGSGAGIIDGNKVIEVKPFQINKGSATMKTFNISEYDICIAIGDDTTDEDLFEAVNKFNGISIKAGNTESIAEYRTESSETVLNFLESLINNSNE